MGEEAIRNRKETVIVTVILSVLIAVLTLTSVGYIRTDNFAINFISVFVVIGAIRYGQTIGALLGAFSGFISFIHCLFPGFDPGHTFILINPYHTFIVCVVPRALMGFCCGLIYKLFLQTCSRRFSTVVASFFGGFLNTMFVALNILLLFYNSDYVQSLGTHFTQMVRNLITPNSYIEWAICTVAGSLVLYIIRLITEKNNKTDSPNFKT